MKLSIIFFLLFLIYISTIFETNKDLPIYREIELVEGINIPKTVVGRLQPGYLYFQFFMFIKSIIKNILS